MSRASRRRVSRLAVALCAAGAVGPTPPPLLESTEELQRWNAELESRLASLEMQMLLSLFGKPLARHGPPPPTTLGAPSPWRANTATADRPATTSLERQTPRAVPPLLHYVRTSCLRPRALLLH